MQGFKLGHRPALDGFRGIAVLMVLSGHLGVAGIARAATTGVSLFFVLSGFLITTLLLEERAATGGVRLGDFYARRALRLFPALVVVLAVVGVYGVIDSAVSAPVTFPTFYLANFAMGSGRSLGLFAHTWSLSMEEQFYVVWPIVLILALRRSRRLATTLAAGGALLSLAIAAVLVGTHRQGPDWDRVRFSPDARSYGLFIGCVAALALPSILRHSTFVRWLLVPAVAACVVASAGTDQSVAEYLLWRPMVTAAAVVLIVGLLDNGNRLTRLARCGPLVYVGRISYGLYLWHYPIYGILAVRLAGIAFWPRAAVMVTVSVLVAASSHCLVERPFLRLQGRFRTAARAWDGSISADHHDPDTSGATPRRWAARSPSASA